MFYTKKMWQRFILFEHNAYFNPIALLMSPRNVELFPFVWLSPQNCPFYYKSLITTLIIVRNFNDRQVNHQIFMGEITKKIK